MNEKLIHTLIDKVQKQQTQIDKLIVIVNKLANKSESSRKRIQSLEDMHFGKVDDLLEGDLPF